MSFQTTERIFALNPALIPTLFPDLLAQFGEDLPDGDRMIRTIGGNWDDDGKTRIRAASLHDGTIEPAPLIDGRVAFSALWQADLAAQFDSAGIPGVAELTPEELTSLRLP